MVYLDWVKRSARHCVRHPVMWIVAALLEWQFARESGVLLMLRGLPSALAVGIVAWALWIGPELYVRSVWRRRHEQLPAGAGLVLCCALIAWCAGISGAGAVVIFLAIPLLLACCWAVVRFAHWFITCRAPS